MIQVDENLEMLNNEIGAMIKRNLYKNREIKCCPHCGCKNYMKYGKYKGIQRFKCKNNECTKTFSQTTKSVWSYSKKNAKKWIEFIELMMEKRTLKYCAKKLEISIVTAFYWRHKVLNSMINDFENVKLLENVQFGKSVMKENFKGCRNIETSEREDIWIVAASGINDVLLSLPICKRTWNLKKFEEKIYSKVERQSYITSYGDRYLQLVANNHNKELEKIEVKADERIKYLRRNLNEWMLCFCGIGTKYLRQYLSWFILFFIDKTINYMTIVTNLMKENSFFKNYDIKNLGEYI
ncbi:hypothetical protein NNC19_13620 [Clostridium sp. SHJSY1]|uniref:IS1/IS1595 family N-terminal zinc-binding domain-containing protein n=1 Tax=Clostridium sp. SHJSY1 TaxID=2942483 RepID=UPI0028761134|nr:hypothetical protein [Clostridium sp. SHJSY1]MDS0526725.1 hypothetical protein [Clostridium sp. SHJSY1]